MEEYLIVDGSNMAYRAHNAYFESKTSGGNPSGIFFGFVKMLMSIKKKYRHFVIFVVWDGKPKEKYALQPDYKANRSKLSSLVWSQVDDVKRYLNSIGVEQFYHPDYEADDVIATLVKSYRDYSDKIYIHSNDKDMLQLVENGKVIVFRPKVGLSPEKFFDEEEVENQFGVKPDMLPFFRSFDGDSSDNLKGVFRVPRKKIASAINLYGSIEGVYNNIDSMNLTQNQKELMDEAKTRVFNNYTLMFLNKDVPNIETTKAIFDKDAVKELFKKYEIKSVSSEDIISLFSTTLNKRYTDPQPAYKLETFSLFG